MSYNFFDNLIFCDSYKFSHFRLYPEGLTSQSSYIEPRGPVDSVVMYFGGLIFLKRVLGTRLTHEMVDDAKTYTPIHGVPFNEKGWRRIVDEFDGWLPLEIQALPEGTVHKTSIPQVQVRETHPDFAWLATYVETKLIRATWFPSTVATKSWKIKQMMRKFLELSVDDENIDSHLAFMLHDFGERGTSSGESAGIGGCAHLVNFMGTDTFEALPYARHIYGEYVAGHSISATEHSIATMYGPGDNEIVYAGKVLSLIEEMAKEGNPFPIAAIVSDSYDLFNFIRKVLGGVWKERITKLPGRLVVRPDSGDPRVVPVEVVKLLCEIFGYTVNKKGFKVLPKFIRVIQGDGVDYNSIHDILKSLTDQGYSAENIVFGMGGRLLGAPQRDDFKYAQKTNSATIDGVTKDVYKDPITDPGKKSKSGRQAVIMYEGMLIAIREDELFDREENLLKVVWRNGVLLVDPKFSEIRERANGFRLS